MCKRNAGTSGAYKEMKEKGVGVAGVVLDTTDEKGNQDEEAVKKAGILQEKTKANYPFLIPDTQS